MASPRLTLGAMLGTISSTANTITGTVEMANQFVSMGQSRVAHMADEQKLKLTLERESMHKTALNNHVVAMTTHMEEIGKFRNANTNRQEIFDNLYTEAQAALAKAFPKE